MSRPTPASNADQRTYWNRTAGPKWVANQAAIDRHMRNATDILFARAAPAPGERVLDIGCGTGETTIRAANLVGDGGTVLAVDISEPMQSLARQRCAAAGLANVDLILADAQTHDFKGRSFDLALSRFGVMFFDDPPVAFRNIRTALTPNGRLCFICWAPMADNPWFMIPLEAAARRLGPPASQPPRTPGPFAFSESGYVTDILRAAGFADIRVEPEKFTFEVAGDLKDAASFACNMGPASRLIVQHEPDTTTLAAIMADVAEEFRIFASADGLQVPGQVFCVRAVNAA